MSSEMGSNEDILESIEEVDYETPLSTPQSSPPLGNSITHDTSRTKYHMKDLESFTANLEKSAKRAFPNRDRSRTRYKNVQVLLLRWAEDDLGVAWEVEDLERTFTSYGFNAETWLIPSENSHLKLMLKAGTFVETHESKDTLFIVYYGGHATINRRRQSTWSCKRDLTYATLEWSAIQIVFEKAKSDVLLLLDCCSAASAAPITGQAVTETIAACGWESIAPEPGRFSFTDTLIKVLQEWISRPFTAAMLHCEMLSRLKHENPELMGTKRVELRRTPIYIVTTGDLSASSIYLAKMEDPSGTSASPEQPLSSPKEDLAIRAPSEGMEEIDRFADTTADGALKTPHVLISLALEENQILDAGACSRWLASFPALAKYAKIQSVFKSHSTLLLVSLPVMIWDLLPEDPACSFIGYICSHNLLDTPSTKKKSGITEFMSEKRMEIESEPNKSNQQRQADINLYEAILEDMASVILVQDFKGKLSTIEQWLRALTEAERTVALYAFLQQTTQVQIEFFTQVLLQMGKTPAVSAAQPAAPTTSAIHSRPGHLGFDRSTIEAMFPDAVAAIEAEKAKFARNLEPQRERPEGNLSTDSGRNQGVEISRRPQQMFSNALPLLQLPDEISKPGPRYSQDTSPFHSSASGSIYSTSSEASRNDRLWALSRSTSISTAPEGLTPVSDSNWTPTGIVTTPQDMRNPLTDVVDWHYRPPQTTSPTSTRQLLGVPVFDQKAGSLNKPPIPIDESSHSGKGGLEQISQRLNDSCRSILICSQHNIGVVVQAHLDPSREESWISPRVAETLKLPVVAEMAFEPSPPWDPKQRSYPSVLAKWRDISKTPSYEYRSSFFVASMPFEVVFGRSLISISADDPAQEMHGRGKEHGDQGHNYIRDSGLGEI